jgi:hypothetical protein
MFCSPGKQKNSGEKGDKKKEGRHFKENFQ